MSTERDQKIEAMQALVNLLRSNPNIPLPHHWANEYGQELLFCMSPEEWHGAVKALGGGKKDADESWLEFKPKQFPWLSVRGYKEKICERVVVGKQLLPETVIPAQPEVVIPAKEVEQVEWRCRPFTEEVA